MAVLAVPAGLTAAQHKAAVRDTAVLLVQFFLADEMYCGIVIREIVRHGLDLFLYLCGVCSFLQDNKALSGMFLTGGELRILSVSHCVKSSLHRNGVLFRIFDAFHSPDSVRMSLADTFSPESIVIAFRQDSVGIETI